jgi:hypothetical protein
VEPAAWGRGSHGRLMIAAGCAADGRASSLFVAARRCSLLVCTQAALRREGGEPKAEAAPKEKKPEGPVKKEKVR